MSRLMRLGFLPLIQLAAIGLLAGCVSRPVQTLADLPLPAAGGADCCWQALQQLDITFRQQHYRLTGVLANTRQGASLVLLDPLGRRLLSVQQQGDALNVYRAPELPADLPDRFLLASSLFVWRAAADWQPVLPATWTLTQGRDTRQLIYKNRPLLRADYDGPWPTGEHTPPDVRLRHLLQPLEIRIHTQRWEALP